MQWALSWQHMQPLRSKAWQGLVWASSWNSYHCHCTSCARPGNYSERARAREMRIHPEPTPQPKHTGGQGLPPVYVLLPVGAPLFEIRQKEGRLWCVFFSFNWLLSSGSSSSLRQDVQCISSFFPSAAIKKFDVHNKKAHFIFLNFKPIALQTNWHTHRHTQKDKHSPTGVYLLHNHHINHYQAWWL